MFCFLQDDRKKQVDITKDFYQFQNLYKLRYNDSISVMNNLQQEIHLTITVNDYLKNLPET